MDGSLEIALLLVLPALGALAAWFAGTARRTLAVTGLSAGAYFAVALATAARTSGGDVLEAGAGWFSADALSGFHLALMGFVFLMASAFACTYFGREIDQGKFDSRLARRFALLWAGALVSMTLVFTSNSLAVMWVGVELTTLSTAFLIRLHVSRGSLEATWKYLVVCSVGVALAFLGIVMLAASARGVVPERDQATMWRALAAAAPNLDPGLVRAGFLFVLVGFGTKAGLAPMHTWLPDAHSQAPSPVSAIFSASLLNASLYVIMRVLPIADGAAGPPGWASGYLVAFGVGSVLLAAAFILFQKDVKRMLAYSSVEHVGVMAIGIGLGPAGALAALFHAFNHSASKSLAFFAAGRIGQAAGSHDVGALAAAAPSTPLWRFGLVASLFSLMGVAPFATFFSEFMVVQAALASGAWMAATLLLVGFGIAFAGMLRHALAIGWAADAPPPAETRRAPWTEGAIVAAPLLAVLVLGLLMPPLLAGALSAAASALGGVAP